MRTLNHWRQNEIDFLISNFQKMSHKDIGKALNRTASSVKHKCIRLSLKIDDKEKSRRFTENIKKNSFFAKSGEDNPNWKGGISNNAYHYKKIQIERYPEKVSARNAVKRAIDSGRLIKGKCESCGSDNTQAHHEDYSRPLDVNWLCPKCHRELHKISGTKNQ